MLACWLVHRCMPHAQPVLACQICLSSRCSLWYWYVAQLAQAQTSWTTRTCSDSARSLGLLDFVVTEGRLICYTSFKEMLQQRFALLSRVPKPAARAPLAPPSPFLSPRARCSAGPAAGLSSRSNSSGPPSSFPKFHLMQIQGPIRRKLSRGDGEQDVEALLPKASAAGSDAAPSAGEPELSRVLACVLVAVCGAFAFGECERR